MSRIHVVKGKVKATKINLISIIKSNIVKTSGPKRGRPSKIQIQQSKFKFNPKASPFFKTGGAESNPALPISFSSGQISGNTGKFRFTAKTLQKTHKAKQATPPPTNKAGWKDENSYRESLLRQYQKAGKQAINDEELMQSSVVEELEPGDQPGHVWVKLGDNWYTYVGVPQKIFDDWWDGKATCITDDETHTKFTGKGRKLWIVGKTPSLGAFYNKYIKGKYTAQAGRV